MPILQENKNQDEILTSGSEMIDLYHDMKGKKKISIIAPGSYTYAIFMKDSEVELTFQIQAPHTQMKCFAFLPTRNERNILNFIAQIEASRVEMEVWMISLQGDKTELGIQGEIQIHENISEVSCSLQEEVYLLGRTTKIYLMPALKVASNQVKTSHGAKVQRLSPEQIFYLESRGIQRKQSEKILIQSYQNTILQQFTLQESEKQYIFSLFK